MLQIAYVEDQLSEGDRTIHQSPKLDLRCQDEVMSKGHSQSGTGCDVVEGDGFDLSITDGYAQHFSRQNTRFKRLLAFGVVQLQISADVANNEQELPTAELDVSDAFRLQLGIKVLQTMK